MRKKLIEVALPLEAISESAAREKSLWRHHHVTMHLYWARRPVGMARAVLFSSIVDDPDQEGLPTRYLAEVDALPRPTNRPDWNALGAGERRRLKLFSFIEQLVKWENSNSTQVMGTAKSLIDAATDGHPPPVWDPFAGGGTIPLEAQRLGLESRGSDLNPLAVLITKALIELPGEVKDQPPTHPERHSLSLQSWSGAQGLAEDVRWWGEWLQKKAERKIGDLYPPVRITSEMVADRSDLQKYSGSDLTVIAWLWTRTVTCPNPACGIKMPLIRSFLVSNKVTKKKGEVISDKRAWLEQSGLWKDRDGASHVRFVVKTKASHPHEQPKTDGTVDRTGATCTHCGEAVPFDYIRKEAKAGRMGEDLMCTVAEGKRERVYLGPTREQIQAASEARPNWAPSGALPAKALGFRVQQYGMKEWWQLFTPRQLTALTTLIDVLREEDQIDDRIRVYLSMVIARCAMSNCTLDRWNSTGEKVQHAFGRQALAMVWDFAEPNVFHTTTGSVESNVLMVVNGFAALPCLEGIARQEDSRKTTVARHLISTDPPYYDNIGYADLSDFFYVWHREVLQTAFPDLFATLLTPKADELIATPYRHEGDKAKAAQFFEDGLADVWKNVKQSQTPDFPVTIYYAYKQTEKGARGDIRFTGWDTMLQAILDAGFMITATWPIRSEMKSRLVASGTNALASNVVLSCRVREGRQSTTRGALIEELRASLPAALGALQTSTLPPVDLAQAAVGPAMGIFSRYSEVLNVKGEKMTVAEVLPLILEQLAEALNDLPDLDPESRFALRWYDAHGWSPGPFGEAETTATAMNIAVSSLDTAGIAQSSGGRVKLIKAESLPRDYDPSADDRFTLWEVVHYLGRALDVGGKKAAAQLLASMQESHPGLRSDAAKELCNALFSAADRNGRNEDAKFYNQLGQLWTEIVVQSAEIDKNTSEPDLFSSK